MPDDSQPPDLGGTPGPAEQTTYQAVRYAFPTGQPFPDFVARYEAAVPSARDDLFADQDWGKIAERTDALAEHGFLIYARISPSRAISLAGRNQARSMVYLMGNHMIAERMYRHHAGVMLYAPLRVEIYEDGAGDAVFSVDKPSMAFGSFSNDEITAVGHELDRKLAALLDFLGVPGPASARLSPGAPTANP